MSLMDWWNQPSKLGRILWYLGAYLAHAALIVVRLQSAPWGHWNILAGIVAAVLLLALFRWIELLAASFFTAPAAVSGEASPAETADIAWPAPLTKRIAVWLAIWGITSLAGFLLAIACFEWCLGRLLANPQALSGQNALQEATIMAFAGGLGSTVASLLAFLKHASSQRDFKIAFEPWYYARPFMGMLLALIFFALIKGGLLLVVPSDADTTNLNDWGLAGLGALVGLFTREALEKLREVFETVFQTRPANVPPAGS